MDANTPIVNTFDKPRAGDLVATEFYLYEIVDNGPIRIFKSKQECTNWTKATNEGKTYVPEYWEVDPSAFHGGFKKA